MKKNDQRIMKANLVDVARQTGWIVDLSAENAVNPDCYFRFPSKRMARWFLYLVDSGMDARQALHVVFG